MPFLMKNYSFYNIEKIISINWVTNNLSLIVGLPSRFDFSGMRMHRDTVLGGECSPKSYLDVWLGNCTFLNKYLYAPFLVYFANRDLY